MNNCTQLLFTTHGTPCIECPTHCCFLGQVPLSVGSLESEQGTEGSFEIPVHVTVDERITPRVDLEIKVQTHIIDTKKIVCVCVCFSP